MSRADSEAMESESEDRTFAVPADVPAGVRPETIHPQYPPSLGAIPLASGSTLFRIWAPKVPDIVLELLPREQPDGTPRQVPLVAEEHGCFSALVADAPPGTLYRFRTGDDTAFPDPASRWQPYGVHQPSAVAAASFDWTDEGWHGLPLRDYILYELHIGTFTPGGTFDSAIARLDDLRDLGITAVELMPVAQCPGGRNWGYDGVHPFAVQNTWGGPDGLKRFVDACHARGMAVVLDVVYNHLGPEGNYLGQFGHYFSSRYSTPWGDAINFDARHCDEVRRFFIENALYWIRDCHIDGLRLDAVHAIFDQSARPFLRELGEAVRQQGELCGRRVCSIAESNLNDPVMIHPPERGGHGLDGQWVDDLHHALHVVLTGEQDGYYSDFHGFADLATAWQHGFVYSGQYSEFRQRRHGDDPADLPLESFVVCSQNHDQVGNRMLGERLAALVSFDQLKLAAGTVLLSPYVPLLFMGQEYGEPAPFPFFVSHGDPGLVQAVRKGRKAEFASFTWQGEPPDPQSETTFDQAKLNHDLRHEGRHAVLYELYRTLIGLRKTHPALRLPDRRHLQLNADPDSRVLSSLQTSPGGSLLVVLHFGETPAEVHVPAPAGHWQVLLDSSAPRWNETGTTENSAGDSTAHHMPAAGTGASGSPTRSLESDGRISLTLPAWSFRVLSSPLTLY